MSGAFKPRKGSQPSAPSRPRTPREHYFEMDIWLRAKPHSGEHVRDIPGSIKCRRCMRAALSVAVSDEASDAEILDFMRTSDRLRPPEVRAFEMELLAVRGETPRAKDEPTQYARSMIAKVPGEAVRMRRNWQRVTKSAMARALGCHRDTLDDWVKRGWLPWPPAE